MTVTNNNNLIPQALAGAGAGATRVNSLLVQALYVPPPAMYARDDNMIIQPLANNPSADTRVSQLICQVLARGRPKQRQMRAWTFNLDGHSYYVLHLEEEGTLVYDQATQQWAEWQSFTAANPTGPWRARCGWNWGVDLIAGDDNVGMIWNVRDDVYQDETASPDFPNYPVNAQLVGGIPQRLRDSTPCNGVMLTYSAGHPITGTVTNVQLMTSDDQGFTYDDQGTVTSTLDTEQDIQWLSLGQIQQPLRLFRISDNGIARIDDLDMW